ncbi:MAG: hypothetical protein U0228_14690 [Myxococcaceae bacterium]
MKIAAPASPAPQHRSLIDQFFARAKAPKHASAPSAVFTEVPASKQAKVAKAVQASLSAQLEGKVPADRRAGVDQLIAHVGKPDFYDVLATLDPKHGKDWTEMANVQRQFAAVEPKYDSKTRAYSESMRLTLHASVIQHFAFPETNKGMSLYDRFIALHPTAFHQNGGWVDNLQIPVSGAAAVAEATPKEMWFHAAGLLGGAFITDAPTVAAAQMVRDARSSALKGWG